MLTARGRNSKFRGKLSNKLCRGKKRKEEEVWGEEKEEEEEKREGEEMRRANEVSLRSALISQLIHASPWERPGR